MPTPEQGNANGREWRTAPLWGLRFKSRFLHDNRARNLDQAILFHASSGSEANTVITNYRMLSGKERAALLRFLNSL